MVEREAGQLHLTIDADDGYRSETRKLRFNERDSEAIWDDGPVVILVFPTFPDTFFRVD